MKRRALLLVPILTNIALSAAQPPTAPPPFAADQWQSLLAKLASPSFAEREKASSQLNALAPADIPFLQRQIAASIDDEVKSRLTTRLQELQGPQLTLQISAPPSNPIDLPLVITFTLTNHFPQPISWSAGVVRVGPTQNSGGGSGTGDSLPFQTSNDPNADVLVPGNASLTTTLASDFILPFAYPTLHGVYKLKSKDASLEKLWNGESSTRSVDIKIAPSPLMAAILAGTPIDPPTQSLFNDLLKASLNNFDTLAASYLAAILEKTNGNSIPYLIAAAKNADPALRATALALIPRTLWASNVAEAIKQSCRAAERDALSDKDTSVRVTSISVLAGMGDPEALPTVIKLTDDKTPAVRAVAFTFLTHFPNDKDAMNAIPRSFSDADPAVVSASLDALDKNAIPHAELFTAAFAIARGKTALRLLPHIVQMIPPGDLLKSLSPNFKDRTSQERLEILSLLAGNIDSEMLPLIQSALSDPDSNVHRTALLRLLPFPGENALSILASHRAIASPELQTLNDTVAAEIQHRTLFPFLKNQNFVAELPFPSVAGTGPRVSPDGQWIAYTQTGSIPLAGGLGRSNLTSITHVVKTDGTGDQIVSDMFFVQWLADSKRIATARDGCASISSLKGDVLAEFGTPDFDPAHPPKLDNSWLLPPPPALGFRDPIMPHTQYLRDVYEYGERSAVTPDGQLLGPLYPAPKPINESSDSPNTVTFIDSGGKVTEVPFADRGFPFGRAGQAVASPDGHTFACWSESRIVLMDLQQKKVTATFPIEATTYGTFDWRQCRWNPFSRDGKQIVFIRDNQIVTANPDGSNPVSHTFDASRKSFPTFSPDGAKIAYLTFQPLHLSSFDDTQTTLCILDLKTSLAVPVTNSGDPIYCLDWLNNNSVIFDRLPAKAPFALGKLETVSLKPP